MNDNLFVIDLDIIQDWLTVKSNELNATVVIQYVTLDKIVRYKSYYAGEWHDGQVPYDYIVEKVVKMRG